MDNADEDMIGNKPKKGALPASNQDAPEARKFAREAHTKAFDESVYKWPDCSPPEDGVISSGFSDGYTQYKKMEVEPGRWQWLPDVEATAILEKYNNSRRELFLALRSRVLTDSEMARVAEYGSVINIEPMEPYRSEDKARELNDALLQQYRLKAMAQAVESNIPKDSTMELSSTFKQSLREDYNRERKLLADAQEVLKVAQQRVEEHRANCEKLAEKFISENDR